MLSLKARFFTFMLQNRNWMQLRLKKQKIDWNTYESILSFREQVEKSARLLGKLPKGITISPISIDEMPAEWVLSEHSSKEKVMLYFHGGGYVSGTCEAHHSIVAKFVKESNVSALLFGYRLAPEHRFPAALEDAMSSYQYLLNKGISPAHILFVGDSAGAGLSLATLLALRDQGIPLPAASVVLSPWTDLKCNGESYRTKVKICLSPEGTAPAFAKHYAGDNALDLPYISPLYGDLHGLPSILMYAGEDETLCDDSVEFARKAKKAGIDVLLTIGKGLFHCYPACSPIFPEAKQAMDEICTFIKTKLDLME